jgi:hypothetical protein
MKVSNEVDHPKHYCSHPSGIETIEITEHMNFCLGNAIKYIMRSGLKTPDPIKDLQKAKWYIEREIKRLTAPLKIVRETSLEQNLQNLGVPASIVKSDDSSWIPWSGGENPIPGKKVRFKCRDGYEDVHAADWIGWWIWNQEWNHDDIVAYKVIKD